MGHNKQQYSIKHAKYTTDRARPGLVTLYDIRPGNGASLFLQPGNPHGVILIRMHSYATTLQCRTVTKSRTNVYSTYIYIGRVG